MRRESEPNFKKRMNISIMAPLMMPIIRNFGINPIHFGVVINMVAVAGGVTPPVGNLLYIACGIAKESVMKAAKALIPFLIAILAAMILCALIPGLVTFIPSMVGG